MGEGPRATRTAEEEPDARVAGSTAVLWSTKRKPEALGGVALPDAALFSAKRGLAAGGLWRGEEEAPDSHEGLGLLRAAPRSMPLQLRVCMPLSTRLAPVEERF
jgi:hypothetical protein